MSWAIVIWRPPRHETVAHFFFRERLQILFCSGDRKSYRKISVRSPALTSHAGSDFLFSQASDRYSENLKFFH